MQQVTEQYRGFQILVQPLMGTDDLWDFEYRITKLDAVAALADGIIWTRTKTAGGYATEDMACMAAGEVARIEIDNLVSLHQA